MHSRFFSFLLSGMLFATMPLHAAPKKIGTFGDWHAYVSTDKGKKVAYMVSFPKAQEGNAKKRGKVYAMITHRPDIKSLNVVSYHLGYRSDKEQKAMVEMKAGGEVKKYSLFTEQEAAWAPSDDLDKEITQQVTKVADQMVVSGTSVKGTKTKDTYSLKGSMKAYAAICEACGVSLKEMPKS